MPKSALSTAQIRDLKDRGVPTSEIARRAGITTVSVTTRLSPESNRKRNREAYQLADAGSRQDYVDTVVKRYHELQKETEEHATRVGLPWAAEEIKFLKLHGPTMTTYDLAIELSRTYAGVSGAAQKYGISLRN